MPPREDAMAPFDEELATEWAVPKGYPTSGLLIAFWCRAETWEPCWA